MANGLSQRGCGRVLFIATASLVASLIFVASPLGQPTANAGALASSVSAGRDHACALTKRGGVKCWGYNYYGQIGVGVRSNSTTPLDVKGLKQGVSYVAAGGNSTCARTTAGGVKCWGDNDHGQLGDGTGTTRLTAVDVGGLTSGVSAISVGFAHACALSGGGVKCWGDNTWGGLGDGTTNNNGNAVDVTGLTSGVAAISAGAGYTCALMTAGGVKCWGNDGNGQLGDGTTNSSSTPVDVVGLSSGVAGIFASATGFHTCALMTTGGIKCWGSNNFGELGDGTTTGSSTPVDVPSLPSGVASVTVGAYHTCALLITGHLRCWGRNDKGELGDGTTIDSSVPVSVKRFPDGAQAVSAGDGFTCGVTTSRVAKCWGGNPFGRLGDGSTIQRHTPTNVEGLPGTPKIFWFSPSSGRAGTWVTIVGFNLDHTTAVTFHGVSAAFAVVSSIKVRAKLPGKATTGYVRIIALGGIAKSTAVFRVS